MQQFIPFGWPVILYLTLTGIASGACLAAVVFIRSKNKNKDLVKMSLWVAVVSLAAGGACLMTDLDSVGNLYHVFTDFNTSSAIAWGSRAIVLFVLLLIYSALLYEKEDPKSVGKLLTLLLVLFALVVGAYPALVLMQSSARPLWGSFVMIPLFLTLGCHSGFSLIQLLTASRWSGEQKAVKRLDMAFILVQALLLGWLLLSSSVSSAGRENLMAGEFALWFWGGVVALGWLFPLILSLRPANPPLVGLRQVCFLGGALALRAVIILGGQHSKAFIGS